jgi:putative heme iron utilization protein
MVKKEEIIVNSFEYYAHKDLLSDLVLEYKQNVQPITNEKGILNLEIETEIIGLLKSAQIAVYKQHRIRRTEFTITKKTLLEDFIDFIDLILADERSEASDMVTNSMPESYWRCLSTKEFDTSLIKINLKGEFENIISNIKS